MNGCSACAATAVNKTQDSAATTRAKRTGTVCRLEYHTSIERPFLHTGVVCVCGRNFIQRLKVNKRDPRPVRPSLRRASLRRYHVSKSASGTFRTSRDVRLESVFGGKAENICSPRAFPVLTHLRHLLLRKSKRADQSLLHQH